MVSIKFRGLQKISAKTIAMLDPVFLLRSVVHINSASTFELLSSSNRGQKFLKFISKSIFLKKPVHYLLRYKMLLNVEHYQPACTMACTYSFWE